MIAELSPPPATTQEPDLRLTSGATLTVRAAEKHARRSGVEQIAPSHLLVAILERPNRRIRDYILERGASIVWLADTAKTGIVQVPDLHGASLESLVVRGLDLAAMDGEKRVDDYYLLLAIMQGGDQLSDHLLREAGLISAPKQVSAEPVAPAADGVSALIAGNSLAQPRVARPSAVPRKKPTSLMRQELRSLRNSTKVSPLFLAIVGLAITSAIGLNVMRSESTLRFLMIVFLITVWLASLCMHEYGHAAAAYMNGDWGVKRRGYLTFDLRNYSNPLLTFGIPLVMLLAGMLPLPGGAVMVDESAFRTAKARRIVAIAGPAANVLVLTILAVPLLMGIDPWSPLGMAMSGAALIQASVIVLNMIPVPPLDGWNFFFAGASAETRYQARALGWFPVIALMFTLRSVVPVNAAYWAVTNGIAVTFQINVLAGEYGWSMLSLAS